jgi:hypothetical protein
MAELKPGARLRSSVCNTEAMVVLTPSGDVDLKCGGAPMIVLGSEPEAGVSISADFSDGTQVGKRYVSEAGDLEVLCTKPGDGSISLGEAALQVKGAKPLPSSD